jgi:anaerobic selenocysteine-containing dehydrogenase
MDETAVNADLILPNHLYLERYEDVPVKAAVVPAIVGLCRPVVEPIYHTRHLGDTVIQIARALKGPVAAAFPWEDYQSCLEETLSDQWNTLTEKGFWVREATGSFMEPNGFATGSGKFEFMNDDLQAAYQADDIPIEGDAQAFPLVLVPYDSIRLASGHIGNPPFMTKTISDDVLKGTESFVEVNPDTADQLGLKQGQRAILSSPRAEVAVRVNRKDGIMPGLVAMPRGLGHTAYNEYLADKGQNVNLLIGPVQDPVTGLDAAWGIRAKLAKA